MNVNFRFWYCWVKLLCFEGLSIVSEASQSSTIRCTNSAGVFSFSLCLAGDDSKCFRMQSKLCCFIYVFVFQLSNLEVWFQRPKDIVRKLLSGDLDLGIVGLDTVSEYGHVSVLSHRMICAIKLWSLEICLGIWELRLSLWLLCFYCALKAKQLKRFIHTLSGTTHFSSCIFSDFVPHKQ